MKTFISITIILLFSASTLIAQNTKDLYNPDENAALEISKAVRKAKAGYKHVLIQVGGNWCKWCILFDEKVKSDKELQDFIKANFEVYHLNYSKENTNESVLKTLAYPQRFGFPVFVILDADGNRLHTQNSAYLEDGQGHSKEKIMKFLENWSPSAVDPKNY